MLLLLLLLALTNVPSMPCAHDCLLLSTTTPISTTQPMTPSVCSQSTAISIHLQSPLETASFVRQTPALDDPRRRRRPAR